MAKMKAQRGYVPRDLIVNVWPAMIIAEVSCDLGDPYRFITGFLSQRPKGLSGTSLP